MDKDEDDGIPMSRISEIMDIVYGFAEKQDWAGLDAHIAALDLSTLRESELVAYCRSPIPFCNRLPSWGALVENSHKRMVELTPKQANRIMQGLTDSNGKLIWEYTPAHPYILSRLIGTEATEAILKDDV